MNDHIRCNTEIERLRSEVSNLRRELAEVRRERDAYQEISLQYAPRRNNARSPQEIERARAAMEEGVVTDGPKTRREYNPTKSGVHRVPGLRFGT